MKDCWLDPNGKIYEVAECGHNDFAEELLKNEMGKELFRESCYGNNKYPYVILHDRGWVRIKYNISYLPKVEVLGGCIDLTKIMRNTMDPAMNEKQIKIVKEICEKVGEDFHRAINDKRFW